MRYFDLIKQLFYKLDKKGLTKTDNAPKIKKQFWRKNIPMTWIISVLVHVLKLKAICLYILYVQPFCKLIFSLLQKKYLN